MGAQDLTTPTPSNMSVTTLPKDIEALTQEGGVKLFGKWDCSEVDCKDISLQDYVQIRNPVWLPHTAGRYASKQFRKAQMPIVERLVCALMMNGRNNGKKQMAVRIVQHALEIVHLMTDSNPAHAKTRPVSVPPVPSVARPSMSPRSDASTSPSPSSPSVSVNPPSETSSPSPNASPTSS